MKPGSSSSASAPPKPTAPSKPPRKPSNPYEDYSTAESLGYTDPDAERMKAEAERRRMQGVAGEWQIISTDVSIPHPGDNKAQVEGQPAPTVDGNRKREAEVVIDDDDGRIFKLRKKKLGVGLGEIYDPGLIPIKLKVKKEEQADTDGLTSIGHQAASGEAKASSTSTAAPKWTARGWTKPSDVQSNQTPTSGDSSAPHDVSQVSPPTREDLPLHTPVAEALVDVKSTISSDSPPIPAVKVESDTVKGEEGETPAPAGGMFRKRKIPGGGNRGRR